MAALDLNFLNFNYLYDYYYLITFFSCLDHDYYTRSKIDHLRGSPGQYANEDV
jgi:hypothetical protein